MRFRLPILLIMLMLSIAACAPASNPAASPAVESSGIQITDALDQSLVFSTPPERIVVAGRGSQMLIHAVYLFPEAVERVVAMEQRLQRGISMLPLVDPRFDEKTQFDRDAAAEQIAPLHPDVVLLKTYLAERLGDPLEQLGIPVVYLELETPEQFLRDIETLGLLLENPERSGEVAAYYQARMDQLDRALQDVPAADRPRALLILHDSRNAEVAFAVPSAEWLQTRMVEMAGGIPVWKEAAAAGGWTIVGFEQIAAWDPDKIILIDYFQDPSLAVEALLEDELWQALRAVQAGEIFAFPGDFLSWDQPDTRWILGLQWLAAMLHPDRLADIDLLAETRAFYAGLYGIDAATFEEQILPLITGDIR